MYGNRVCSSEYIAKNDFSSNCQKVVSDGW